MRDGVRITANFDSNLQSICAFLADHDAREAFDGRFGRLFDDIVPFLQRFPTMGRDFLALDPLSDEGKARLQALNARAWASG